MIRILYARSGSSRPAPRLAAMRSGRVSPRLLLTIVGLIAVMATIVAVVFVQDDPSDQRQASPPAAVARTESEEHRADVQGEPVPIESEHEGEADHNSVGQITPTAAASVSITTSRGAARVAELRAILDPTQDGWQSEQFSEAAGRQLDRLGQFVAGRESIDEATVRQIAVEEVRFTPFRPDRLDTLLDGPVFQVRQGVVADGAVEPSRDGRQDLVAGLRDWMSPFDGSSEVHWKTKIVGVSQGAASIVTDVLVQVSGEQSQQRWQVNAKWQCQWKVDPSKELPQLEEIRTGEYAEVVAKSRNGPFFTDCTASVVGHESSYQDQLRYGVDHWIGRIERVHRMELYSRHGLAVGDVDGNGLDDLYVCQPGGLPNLLFIHQPGGSAQEFAQQAGVDWLDRTTSALFVDLDNDDDQDLVLATHEGLLIMANDRGKKFTLERNLPIESDAQSLSAADYDNDGDLDLFVCVDFASTPATPATGDGGPNPFLYHDANDGGANVLFRNDHQATNGSPWDFTDVTRDVGLGDERLRHSLAAAWEDYDNDGDPDLYVANDYGPNCLFRNDDGRFVNIAGAAGVVDHGSGMSVSWGDSNRDGKADLYVGNMFSSAGSRITGQQQFKPSAKNDLRSIYRRFAKGNSLFENLGDGKFRDVGQAANVEMGRWAWSSLFADINNDGWEDLLVANGFITTEDTGDL